MFKFFLGAAAGLAANLSFFETFVSMVIGMMTSVVLITYGGGYVFSRFKMKKKNTFSKYSRIVVRVWRLFGIWGISFLTPPLLTPIGGTLMAIGFKVDSKKIVFSMAVSAVIWGLLICLFAFQAKEFFLSVFKH
ncbi:MAG: hypothetical protein SNJ77_02830 [Cytophagales bacterium]